MYIDQGMAFELLSKLWKHTCIGPYKLVEKTLYIIASVTWT